MGNTPLPLKGMNLDMQTLNHPHGEVTRSIVAFFRADPMNNVGRWCDVDAKTHNMLAPDFRIERNGRGWSVRGYEGQMDCGCHRYHLTSLGLPTGLMAVPFKALGCDAPHVEMMNLY